MTNIENHSIISVGAFDAPTLNDLTKLRPLGTADSIEVLT